VSGLSFLPRPKTPERRTVTPVFKARTPERQMQFKIAPILPVPMIGRKQTISKLMESCRLRLSQLMAKISKIRHLENGKY
jgi:hypothetical protein